jgi:outer membrane protein
MTIVRLKFSLSSILFFTLFISAFPAIGIGAELTLDQCIKMGIARNPAVLASIERKTKAEWAKKVAHRDFYPKLNLDYSYTYFKDAASIDANFIGVGEVSISEHNNYRMGLHVDQPLFTGFRIMESYNLAGIGLKEAQAGEELANLEIIYQTSAAYYDLLQTIRLQKVMDDEVAMLTSHLRSAQSFYDNEKIPLNNLLQSKVHLANAEQSARNASTMTGLGRIRLATIIKEPLTNDLVVSNTVETAPLSASLPAITSQALDTRPELIQANYGLEAARKQIQMAKSYYYPTISLQAAHNRYGGDAWVDGTGTSALQTPRETMVGVYASWELIDWGQTRYSVSQAEAESREANQNLAQAMDAVILEVNSNYDQAINAFNNIEPARLAVEQAKENLRMNEIRYKNQLSTDTDVLDARSLLTETEFNLYAAIYDYHIWLAGLSRAVGVSNWKELRNE